MKTAISIQRALFDKADALARELNIPRSQLFSLAVEDFIKRYQDRQLLDQINEAYQDQPDPNDERRLLLARRQQRQIIADEW